MLPPQVLGLSDTPGLVCPFAARVVGSQHGVKGTNDAPPPTSLASPYRTRTVGPGVVEKTATQNRLLVRAHRRGGAGVAHQSPVVVVKVDAVGVDGTGCASAKVVVHRQVAARLREQSRAQAISSGFPPRATESTRQELLPASPAPRNCASVPQLGAKRGVMA